MTRTDVTLDDIRAREARHVLQTYKRQPIAFVRGKGVHLYDTDGREYLDFVSGIGVASLGHAHPGLTRVITEQASTLLHTSNLYYHPYQADAASRLARLSGLARAFGQADAVATVRDVAQRCSLRLAGSHVLPESYEFNYSAVAVSKGREGRLAFVSELLEDIKRSGSLQKIIDGSGLNGFELVR
jgi:acetylornithine/succinyldiaminopimelate/putrescine aminotransferase